MHTDCCDTVRHKCSVMHSNRKLGFAGAELSLTLFVWLAGFGVRTHFKKWLWDKLILSLVLAAASLIWQIVKEVTQ